MKFNYYNLDKDKYKERSNYKKKKLFTISFNHILEEIQFENSDRGIMLWIVTPKTVRVFGHFKQGDNSRIKKFYRSWTNDHCTCG